MIAASVFACVCVVSGCALAAWVLHLRHLPRVTPAEVADLEKRLAAVEKHHLGNALSRGR